MNTVLSEHMNVVEDDDIAYVLIEADYDVSAEFQASFTKEESERIDRVMIEYNEIQTLIEERMEKI